MSENTPAATTQSLSFFLAGDEYALGIPRARELIGYDTVTRLPAGRGAEIHPAAGPR